jgi:uncharacterized protein YjbI with pentapeptide repeats
MRNFSMRKLYLATAFVTTWTILSPLVRADVLRWDNGQVIPGTEEIVPGPRLRLSGWHTPERNLQYADFSDLDLFGADFSSNWLDDARFTRAHLNPANFMFSALSNADFMAADLTNAQLEVTTLSDANLRNANLTDANLNGASLINANLSGSIITRINLGQTTRGGFRKNQLYSTQNYQQKDLRGVNLSLNNLRGWDFERQDLAFANFSSSTLSDSNFTDAVVVGGDFGASDLTEQQLRSTRSYQERDLRGVSFWTNDLTSWDLQNQNLTAASFGWSTLSNVNLKGAYLKNANLERVIGLESAVVDSGTVYNQWTIFPDDFDPVAAGLTLEPSLIGDIDADGRLTPRDVELLECRIRFGCYGATPPGPPYWLDDGLFDLNDDGEIEPTDIYAWVKDAKGTYLGDANLDGAFNSSDLVDVFTAGQYEDGIRQNSTWTTGDWNGDWDFTTRDIIAAFQDGGFELRIRDVVNTVPEPTSFRILMVGLMIIAVRHTSAVRHSLI